MWKLKIWYRAWFLDYPYWRVDYLNTEKTKLLYYREARGCKEVFGGKMYIDYEAIKKSES